MLADEIEQALDEVKRVYQLNVELLENLHATVMWFAESGIRIANAETLWRLMREAVRLGEEIGTPLTPCHHFIKPLRRTQPLIEDRPPPDDATVCPLGGVLSPFWND